MKETIREATRGERLRRQSSRFFSFPTYNANDYRVVGVGAILHWMSEERQRLVAVSERCQTSLCYRQDADQLA